MSKRINTVADGVNHVSKIKKFLKDQSGATAIEYGLIAAGIAVAIIAIVNTLGANLNAVFKKVSDQLQ
jgi:pilus assembly protein Flp/PilA